MTRYRCRQNGCPNTYTDVVGGDNAFGKHKGHADCLPCFFAAQLIENGQTPEQIETMPHLVASFRDKLAPMGWTWDDVKASYARKPALK